MTQKTEMPMISQQTLTNIAYLNGMSVAFHIYRELVKSIENITYDKDISYRDKSTKITENCTSNMKILESMLESFKEDLELDSELALKFNPETKEYEILTQENQS